MGSAVPENKSRDFQIIAAVWFLLAAALVALAIPNRSVPGLYYDEAHCAGMARDFLTGHAHPHLVDSRIISLAGRPFPLYAQNYIGALKSWMMMPSLALFGRGQTVLRMTALGWALLALLVFMLWTGRWLGRGPALLAGALLAFDPNFFFLNLFDWGIVFPSFLCRFACFYFALRWWRKEASNRKIWAFAFLAGFFAGLGFFNKIDFAVVLGGVLLAFVCCHFRELRAKLNLGQCIAAGAGFLLAGGPMLAHIPEIIRGLPAGGHHGSELREKIDTFLAMYDGSYFYRLMNAGGPFEKLYLTSAPVFVPLGIGFVMAAGYLVFRLGNRATMFILLSALFITIGVFRLPGAVRIHHAVLVYPFPHLAIALALARLAHRKLAAGLFAALLAAQILALCQTQQLIRETGGRGWWSDALTRFASQIRNRSDLTIASLDWGFNEQLAFLTDGPKLTEPFWRQTPVDLLATNVIYLAHPPQYTLSSFGQTCLEKARAAGSTGLQIEPWYDHQGQIAFYAIHSSSVK